MTESEDDIQRYDVLVVGAGPAGQKAAIQAAKVGRSVCVVERNKSVGGACVHRGTIPSKALKEIAVGLQAMRSALSGAMELDLPAEVKLASLLHRVHGVTDAQVGIIQNQLDRNDIRTIHGRARFEGPHRVVVESVRGAATVIEAESIILATGSRPRRPEGIPVDHEHVLDSDSILSINYLPASLTVLGGGIIGSEYASIFASLGVSVTLIDRAPLPIGFLDPELSGRFAERFESNKGCTYIGSAKVDSVEWDGYREVVTRLDNGWIAKSEKLLCALGREANVQGLNLEAAGIHMTGRTIDVDDCCRTEVPHIFAVGDIAGPPALASSSMEQGRRAARAACGLDTGNAAETLPVGIYTIPEISSVGLSEREATERYGSCIVGRSDFSEIARAQISHRADGFLKLVADPDGRRILGAQAIGEGVTELIHLAQMAMVQEAEVEVFVENIFNFPTMAEAYRVAALDVVRQRVPAPTVSGADRS